MRTLAIFLTLLLAACGAASSSKKEGAPLALGLTSFESRTEALAKFVPGHQSEVIEDSSVEAKGSRPPFSVYSVRVLNVSDEGLTGQLRLDFFNDRLMGISFFPDNVPAYWSKLQAASSGVPADPRVDRWMAQDFVGRWYVSWVDKKLQAEQNAWIDQYG